MLGRQIQRCGRRVGDARSSGGDVGCFWVVLCRRPEIQGPGVSTRVEYRRHTRAQISPVVALGLRLLACHGLLVRKLFAEIQRARSPVEPTGLPEVDVRIHEPGQDPGAVLKLDALGVVGSGTAFGVSHTDDLLAGDDDAGVRSYRTTAAVEQVASIEDERPLGLTLSGPPGGNRRNRKHEKQKKGRARWHHRLHPHKGGSQLVMSEASWEQYRREQERRDARHEYHGSFRPGVHGAPAASSSASSPGRSAVRSAESSALNWSKPSCATSRLCA